MKRTLGAIACAVAALTATSCEGVVSTFDVPASVCTGSDFRVFIAGTNTSGASNAHLACVLQLPPGFHVVGHGETSSPDTPIYDDPFIHGLYTAEPGHTLTSVFAYYSPSVFSPVPFTEIFLRAPATPGTYVIKVSGVTFDPVVHPTDPYQVSDFSLIVDPAHAKTITVAPSATRFATELRDLTVGVIPVTADFDRDGRDDLVFQNHVELQRPGGAVNSLLPAFLPDNATTVVGDFDGDRYPDIAVAEVGVLFSHVNGTWAHVPSPAGIGNGRFDRGDFDGDGIDELVFTGTYGAVFQRVTFHMARHRMFILGSGPPLNIGVFRSVDFDHDGDDEVVSTSGLWDRDPSGTWQLIAPLPPPYYHSQQTVFLADLTADGQAEVIAVKTESTRLGVMSGRFAYELRNGVWQRLTGTGLPEGPMMVMDVVDANGDGWSDLILRVGQESGNELWLNQGNGTFQMDPVSLSTLEYWLFSPIQGDFNGDGFTDGAYRVSLPNQVGHDLILLWNRSPETRSYGAPCAAAGFPSPVLEVVGTPSVGLGRIVLDLRQGSSGGAGLIWLGFSQTFSHAIRLPYSMAPFGAPDCQVLAQPRSLFLLPLDGNGKGRLSVPIPNNVALPLFPLFAQGATSAPGANPLGLLTTNGLRIRLQ